MWTHPKTDWKFDDDFDLYTDYFRIKNNILWLQKLIGEEYRPFALIPMNDYGVDGIGFADFYNNIERNIDILADAGFRNSKIQPTRTWNANRAIWNFSDLNRIEGALLILHNDLMSARANRPVLSMTLGVNQYIEPKILAQEG
ncbi:MAG TPA: hypothetical protein DEB31_01660 [Clostridiales bacterium]|nr:hypothetical protein [Clostridiales bacterium]